MYACTYVCVSLCVVGGWVSIKRPCVVMYLRVCDCVRLGVRNSEYVCEIDCARGRPSVPGRFCVCLVEIIMRLCVGGF